MRRRAPITALAALALAPALLVAPSASASSSLANLPCPAGTGFTCSSLAVPLDRSGAVPGTISLSIERKAAGATPTRSAVLALAGGPGQAALPLAAFIAQAIAPALSSRDLLAYDQRGTGESDPLSCAALELSSSEPLTRLFERCALEIGPARGSFTTHESVEDIESLRVAGGYDKLVLYGTSYGTKVALEYAQRYPQHVEALVLDSVVPSDGPEPFAIPTLQAVGPVLGELCENRACAGITANPLGDIARLISQLRRHSLSGAVYDGSGRRHASALSEAGLLGILEAGDLNPALRALLPAAVQSALRRDSAPLLRLHLLSEGLIPNTPANTPAERQRALDETLFATTTCEESPFPWQRSAPQAVRLSEAISFLRAQPAGDFYPFDSATALTNSLAPDCAAWPDASPPPPSAGALPNVPTLILSGAQDLRTPTSNARRVAALIPDAQVLVVPFTGHSVLGSDLSGCASRAVGAFFTSATVLPCASPSDAFAPTPISPTGLAGVHPPASFSGKPGRTLVAVLDTIVDLDRQVIGATLEVEQELPSGSSFGGLHGGYARLSASSAVLRGFSFVPGVVLNGIFPVRNGELQPATIRISGSAGSPGSVRLGPSAKQVTGTLGGRRFAVSLAKVRLSSLGGGEWPSRPVLVADLNRLAPGRGAGLAPLSWLP